MPGSYVARAETTIDVPVAEVWNALVSPEAVKQFMFGTTVVSDWKEGSPIVWKGEWKGNAYEDRGLILRLLPHRLLRYSHYSPSSGLPDVPENHHTVTIDLVPQGPRRTAVSLVQDNNASEEARQHSQRNWSAMLESLKGFLERTAVQDEPRAL